MLAEGQSIIVTYAGEKFPAHVYRLYVGSEFYLCMPTNRVASIIHRDDVRPCDRDPAGDIARATDALADICARSGIPEADLAAIIATVPDGVPIEALAARQVAVYTEARRRSTLTPF